MKLLFPGDLLPVYDKIPACQTTLQIEISSGCFKTDYYIVNIIIVSAHGILVLSAISSNVGSGEPVQMHRLIRAFAA